MCTAVTYQTRDCYFGRTLDYEFSYGEGVTVTPRHYPFRFRYVDSMDCHFAMIGMAHVVDEYPLYYDAVNECGLGMAGLNFVGNAVYQEPEQDKDNVVQFEFVPWILGQCESVEDVRCLLKRINLVGDAFNDKYPVSELHWIISDRKEAITVESVQEGLRVYDNPVGVLTNNPPFDEQMFQLNNYMQLSVKAPQNNFCKHLPLHAYSRGMGALGLPGDLSSVSRFVRASFVKTNSVSGESESESVSQFFHILGSVDQQRGCCVLDDDKYEVTLFTSCCNMDRGIYYYTSYDNHQITAVDMHRENLAGRRLCTYRRIQGEQIRYQN